MNVSGVRTRQIGRQRFSASQNHESAGIILWIYTKKCQLKKGQMKQSAVSLQSFQLQFEVIVLAVLLAISSVQQCPDG